MSVLKALTDAIRDSFPCRSALLGAGKYGLTQLRNLGRLPATGAVVVTGPLPIVSGSGSPCRALALVERS
jgi:kynurenine formamidase